MFPEVDNNDEEKSLRKVPAYVRQMHGLRTLNKSLRRSMLIKYIFYFFYFFAKMKNIKVSNKYANNKQK